MPMITDIDVVSHEGTRSKGKRKRDKIDTVVSKLKKVKTSEKTIILKSDITEESSPFHIQTSSLYLPLSAVSQKYPIEGICAEYLSPLILTYYPPFNGLILSYSDPIISESPFQNDGDTVLMKNIDEYAVSWAWLTAEFLLLKPEKGTLLEGMITLQNEGLLAVVCWNLFNASIERGRLPNDWEWRETCGTVNYGIDSQNQTNDEVTGFYVDRKGQRVEGLVKFRVADIESSQDKERGFLTIVGTMLSDEDEMAYVKSLRVEEKTCRASAGRRLGGPKALGATNLGSVYCENRS